MGFLGLACKWKAGDSIEIFADSHLRQSGVSEKVSYDFSLIIANFESYKPPGREVLGAFGAEWTEEIESIWTAEKSHVRVVVDLGIEFGSFSLSDIGKVGYDEVERAFNRGEEVAFDEGGVDFEAIGIFFTKSECLCG